VAGLELESASVLGLLAHRETLAQGVAILGHRGAPESEA
jgi:hypothetical protein